MEQALSDVNRPTPGIASESIGLALGSGLGPAEEIESWLDSEDPLSDEWLEELTFEAYAARLAGDGRSPAVAERLGGPRSVFSAACVSSLIATEQAAADIAMDRADCMLVGGVDTLGSVIHSGFYGLQALSVSGCLRPFDVAHDGIVIGEGSCFVALESLDDARARGAEIYGCLSSQRLVSDCHHLISPDPSGDGMTRAITSVLDDARVAPGEVGCITVTATGSPVYDRMLSLAVEKALGDFAHEIPTTTFEPAVGHILAASGPLAVAHASMLIRDGQIHPAYNVEHVAPYCRLHYTLGEPVPLKSPVVLTLVVGFGGQNGVSLVTGTELY
jgi:3-oxoacyl-[acyl-carrier-protein] synthase II